MSILVAVADSKEGQAALTAAAAEAQQLNTDLVVNLALHTLDVSALPATLDHEVVNRLGSTEANQVDVVLDALEKRPDVTRLVIGLNDAPPSARPCWAAPRSGCCWSRPSRSSPPRGPPRNPSTAGSAKPRAGIPGYGCW